MNPFESFIECNEFDPRLSPFYLAQCRLGRAREVIAGLSNLEDAHNMFGRINNVKN